LIFVVSSLLLPDCPFQGPHHTVAAKHRPQILSHWIQCGRKYDSQPSIKDLPGFITAWRLWWFSLQPEPRKAGLENSVAWPLQRVVNDGEKWPEVRKGSRNGIFGVVLALSWWLKAVQTDSEREIFKEVLADVKWVFSHIVRCHVGAEKHPREVDIHESRSTKRYVYHLTFLAQDSCHDLGLSWPNVLDLGLMPFSPLCFPLCTCTILSIHLADVFVSSYLHMPGLILTHIDFHV
jgi:hypothetical protein